MKAHRIIVLTIAMLFQLSAYAQEKSAPPDPSATIAAIEGGTVTLRSYEGQTLTLSVRSSENLKVGQHTSWCEEDCREINVWVPFEVKRMKPSK